MPDKYDPKFESSEDAREPLPVEPAPNLREEKPRLGRPRKRPDSEFIRRREGAWDEEKIALEFIRGSLSGEYETAQDMAAKCNIPPGRLSLALRRTKARQRLMIERNVQSAGHKKATELVEELEKGLTTLTDFHRGMLLQMELDIIKLSDDREVSADVRAKLKQSYLDRLRSIVKDDPSQRDARTLDPDEEEEAWALLKQRRAIRSAAFQEASEALGQSESGVPAEPPPSV